MWILYVLIAFVVADVVAVAWLLAAARREAAAKLSTDSSPRVTAPPGVRSSAAPTEPEGVTSAHGPTAPTVAPRAPVADTRREHDRLLLEEMAAVMEEPSGMGNVPIAELDPIPVPDVPAALGVNPRVVLAATPDEANHAIDRLRRLERDRETTELRIQALEKALADVRAAAEQSLNEAIARATVLRDDLHQQRENLQEIVFLQEGYRYLLDQWGAPAEPEAAAHRDASRA